MFMSENDIAIKDEILRIAEIFDAKIIDVSTDTYTLEIEYVNMTNVDQSVDMGAELSFRINIGE